MELENLRFGTELLKRGFAKMQKGGVIMDVTTPEQAIIAEEAGAVAVMALHAVPADIRKMGGVARMADPAVIESIIDAVTIPVMAKARIGHFVEAQILEPLEWIWWTSRRSSPRRTSFTLKRPSSPYHLSAELGIWAKLAGASKKARP